MDNLSEWRRFENYNYIMRYIRYRRNQLSEKFLKHEYWPLPIFEARHKLLSIEVTNRIISQAIDSGGPFWVGRWGGTEMNMVYEFLRYEYYPQYDNRADATQRLCQLSGFFPNDIEMGKLFVNMILDVCKDIDLQAMWGRYMADYIYYKYQPSTRLTRLDRIEPWNMCFSKSVEKPWSSHLKGKRVLVIHPFTESIQKQYRDYRTSIFSNIYEEGDILPEFELITIKSVQTLAGETDSRFRTWFEALEWMTNEIKRIEFDVAIIGCGAYGYLLSAEVKRMGKVAIHLAGATQLMFGITGTRWEKEFGYKAFREKVINDSWIKPLPSETIAKKSSVEEGCYW